MRLVEESNEMGKKTFVACLVFITVSVWLIAMAFVVFPIAETFTETKVPYGPQGFIFGTSEEMNSSKSEFKIILRDLEFEKGKINSISI